MSLIVSTVSVMYVLGVRQQVGDLRADERADGGDEHEEDGEDAEQDAARSRVPRRQPRRARRLTPGSMARDRNTEIATRTNSPLSLPHEEPHGEGAEEAAPEHDDGRDDPARQAAFVGRRDDELLGHLVRPRPPPSARPSTMAASSSWSSGGWVAGRPGSVDTCGAYEAVRPSRGRFDLQGRQSLPAQRRRQVAARRRGDDVELEPAGHRAAAPRPGCRRPRRSSTPGSA